MTVNDRGQTGPSFLKASEDFRAFLANESISSDLVWIFREDVVSRRGGIYIKEPLPPENTHLSEILFHRGWARGFGVSLKVLCRLGSRHCGYVWLPETERDAELALVAGLKMSVPTKLPVASPVRSWLQWKLYKSLDEHGYWVEELPRRNTQQIGGREPR